ncbi:hypothetical protein CEH05_19930 [Halobacillus halophilus]|uniref:RNA polymerase sigma-70 region 4 domain-containing protein n=1 Tax=Halobacillus halophilus (strain ATCC 35676 / DSM 2266 / JCM 20832 / KCTC 3685 / LMG 17431 / NBRC 102448 / NCIMB 2269) TaxID=866895 RepID=I0JTC7_HALH3|nr:hypothetical protein CEH05_19930 [Halobacillus halophilus]CCG47399.1 conserved hypothetical protein [Halobacillus halophilus DSM 2266]
MHQRSRFHYLFNPCTFYCLLEFNLSKNIIDKLVGDGFVVNDFLVGSTKVSQMQMKKKAITQKVIEALASLTPEEYVQSVYKLGAANLSTANIRLLVDNDITYPQLASMTYDVFFERIGRKNKKAIFKRIMEAYNSCETLFQLDISPKMYNFYLFQICEQLPPRHYVTIDSLCNELSFKLQLPKIEIDKQRIKQFLEKKTTEKYLTYTPRLGFTKNYRTIKLFLARDFNDKYILIRRMNGETLKEIGVSLGVSRERIRQREAKLLNRLPQLEELIYYKEIFETYNWDENLFSAVYGEALEVYQLLNVRLKRGVKSAIEALRELPLTEEQQRIILEHFNCYINFEKQVVSYNNKVAFFEHLMYHFGQTAVSNEEFIEVANDYIAEHQLSPSLFYTERSGLGIPDRSQKILRTKSNSFRFYDTTIIEPEVINHLKDLLDLDPGVYHMSKLFKENEALMFELNVNSEYELHNLYKKCIEVEGVTFTKMPEFCVKTKKDEFLKSLFYELAPISIEKFLVYVENTYGLRKDSLYSLLYSEAYLPFIHNNEIKVKYTKVSEEEYAMVAPLLKDDIYTVQEFIALGAVKISNFKEKFINNQALMKLNYSLKGIFVLHRKYLSVDQYFTELILKDDIFKNIRTRHFKTNHFLTALYNLEKNLEIVKVAPDVYLTNEKLENVGVTKEELVAYRDAAFEFANTPYFTYYYLKNEGFEHELEDYGFEEIFYERLIWTHPELRALYTKKCTIFSKGRHDFTLKDVLEWLFNQNVDSLDFDLLQIRLQKKFGIYIKREKLLYTLQNSELYYSKEMNKIYRNKKIFYEVIYS